MDPMLLMRTYAGRVVFVLACCLVVFAQSSYAQLVSVPDTARQAFLGSTYRAGDKIVVITADGKLTGGRFLRLEPVDQLMKIETASTWEVYPLDSISGVKYWGKSKVKAIPALVGIFAGAAVGYLILGGNDNSSAGSGIGSSELSHMMVGGLLGCTVVSLSYVIPRCRTVQFEHQP